MLLSLLILFGDFDGVYSSFFGFPTSCFFGRFEDLCGEVFGGNLRVVGEFGK